MDPGAGNCKFSRENSGLWPCRIKGYAHQDGLAYGRAVSRAMPIKTAWPMAVPYQGLCPSRRPGLWPCRIKGYAHQDGLAYGRAVSRAMPIKTAWLMSHTFSSNGPKERGVPY